MALWFSNYQCRHSNDELAYQRPSSDINYSPAVLTVASYFQQRGAGLMLQRNARSEHAISTSI
jgi:hypothetical protein